LPDTIDRVRPSVVAVGTHQPARRPPAAFRGTGFTVDDGRLIVTNYHVLPESLDTARRERIAVFSGRGKRARVHLAEVLSKDPVHDLAILQIEGAALPALTLGSAKGVREGEEVAFTGFPIGMVLGLYPVTHRGIVSALSPVVIPQLGSKNLTNKMIQTLRDPYDVLQLDATAYPGNSGSPVYDRRSGEVIGVINSVFVKGTKESALEHPTGITYAIPVKFVKALLRQARAKRN
jgi:S1-C subfamily serine protease